MIPRETIDKIIDRADIYDVVSEYVTLKRSGASYKGLCPFHDDTTPSFYVNPAKSICKCFSCGKGGNAVHFIMEMEQLDFIGAIRFLGKRYGIEVEDEELTPEQRQRQNEKESMYALNEWACSFFCKALNDTEEGKTVGQAYFRSRGIRDDIVEKFRLGFAQKSFDNLSKSALKKGYKEEYLTATGLSFKKENGTLRDKFYERVMFPWIDISGKVVGFGGRVLDSRTKGVNQKYVNSPDSIIYHKGSQLYGIFQAKKSISKEKRVYMVEGYTDVLSMHQCGIENVVANSGTALSYEQIRLLQRFTDNITLLYDGDTAGIHAALRGTDMFLEKGMRVKILLLPDGEDPDSFARKKSAVEFREYIEKNQTDFITFKTRLLMDESGSDPHRRADLIKEIVASIAVIPDEIDRSVYIHQCSEMLKVKEDMLIREVSRKRYEIRQERQKNREREERREARIQNSESEVQGSESNAQKSETRDDSSESIVQSPVEKRESEIDSVVNQIANGGQNTEGENHKLIGIEEEILKMVVRHGEEYISYTDDEGHSADMQLIDYVVQELAVDEIQFRHPLYRQMLTLANDYMQGEPDKPLNQWFTSYPDVQVSYAAVTMMTDRYKLSETESKVHDVESKDEMNDAAKNEAKKKVKAEVNARTVSEQIIRLLLDYKYEIVCGEIKKLQSRVRETAKMSSEETQRFVSDLMLYSKLKRQFAKKLGDRVID